VNEAELALAARNCLDWMGRDYREGLDIETATANIVALVLAERERCAKLAGREGPCCLSQRCHEEIARRIREGS